MKLILRARGWVMLVVLTLLVAVGSFAVAAPSDEAAASGSVSSVLVIEADSAAGGTRAGFPEEAAMVLVGTALIGVAAAVRRAA